MKKIFGIVILLMLAVASFAQIDYASFLERKESIVDNEIEISTPFSKDLVFDKFIKDGVTTYYLYVHTDDSYCTAGGSGITVVFTDGTKWSRPSEEVDMNYYGGDGYVYSVMVRLNQDDRTKFSTKTIKAYKLYIFERSVSADDGETIRETMAALLKAK